MSRYLGNKTALLPPILQAVAAVTPDGGTVGDLFAGTMVVSLALKSAGYNVVANDINHFSTTTGRAFLQPNTIPEVDLGLVPEDVRAARLAWADGLLAGLQGVQGYTFLADVEAAEQYRRVVALLGYLNAATVADVPADEVRSHFFDTYTEEGAHSAFRSSRGTEGRRRFFSAANGQRLDLILGILRSWWTRSLISPELLALVTSTLCRAAEKVGNNQGTWHDFPRDWIDSRALQELQLEPPAMDATLTGGLHVVGDAEDSLEFADTCPPLDTLYLDPPYNFRQYTAYYFLPNAITMYPHLEDPDDWFSRVEFVRGQNMESDFKSKFCGKDTFLDALGDLISRTPTQHVVLSYFNGRNHWNDFKKDPNGVGLKRLTDFFKSDLFGAGSLTVQPVPRKNYQSYKGHKGKPIDEYLFTAEKL